ncbi:26S proteasome regulatory subunit 4 homolog A [Tanacetum coccineum]
MVSQVGIHIYVFTYGNVHDLIPMGFLFAKVSNSTSATFLRVAGSELIQKYDAHSGGEREIQRTMLELLNQLDGFDRKGDVKVILANIQIDVLTALISTW